MAKGGGQSETLYDILKLRSDCSDKDIRNAYVQLSKQLHPDVTGATKDHENFVKISEAYQTLSKPKMRQQYDEVLKAAQTMRIYETKSSRTESHRPWEIKPDYDPNPGPYYGVKGLNRITNSKVAVVLIFFGITAGIIGVFSVRHGFTHNQQRLDEISAKASEHHQRIRSEVEKSTTEENVRRVIERMANRAER